MIMTVVVVSILLLLLGYIFYGRFLANRLQLNDSNPTPASTINDGVDYVPAKPVLLLGQHLSAISAAGPIVGPILAALWFGWLPALLWIVFGAGFFGAVHDFSALVSSVRPRARSIVELVQEELGHRAPVLFMGFVWLSLIYVIIAFADLTASSFVEPTYGGGVASSSALYLIAAVVMGLCLYKLRMPLWLATSIFLPVVGLIIWLGQSLPLAMPSKLAWNGIILTYCFVA